MDPAGLIDRLRQAGVARGRALAVAIDRSVGLGLADTDRSWSAAGPGGAGAVAAIEEELRPRWVVWSRDTAAVLVEAGVRVSTAWDLAAVHRLSAGGGPADPATVWAAAHRRPLAGLPSGGEPDLWSTLDDPGGDPDDPVRPDGYLRPDWVSGGWRATPGRLAAWAALAAGVAALQRQDLTGRAGHPTALVTAHSESAAELLCAEMTVDGLPMDRRVAEEIIAGFVGPRPRSDAEAAAATARRDALVLAHLPPGVEVDLRSSAQVKALLGHLGVEVADTRAWRLREVRDRHPVVGAFLEWRKAERMATTYGYAWLDRHLGADGRLRGTWAASDGAAGRMAASAGLHNMPAELRPAVVAEPGCVFVRADLGQIEPRVLAAVSGDAALARATLDDDLYLPVAAQLGVDRATAKVAVLGAMYGQTTGHGAQALRRLASAYPGAIAYLERAARAAEAGRDLTTYGGRRVRMGPAGAYRGAEAPAAVAARGRFGRNAVIQGAAAELFKTWAVTVRARGRDLAARIVLCLHDELLVQVPAARAADATRLLEAGLQEAVRRWAPDTPVRFVADISVITRWSDAKEGANDGANDGATDGARDEAEEPDPRR